MTVNMVDTKNAIAPYSDVNPAVLANTFNVVNVFYGQDRDKWFDEHIADDELNAVVKLGNFGKIYIYFFNEAIYTTIVF